MSVQIHPSAVVEDGAQVGDGCRIGPFCHVGPHVVLGANNVLHAGVVIDGYTVLGAGNEIFPYACLGKAPQDLKFAEDWVSHTRIGDRNVIREYVTVNSSAADGGATTIGSRCMLMSYSHIAHDCRLGDDVILASDAKISGHVELGDRVIIGGKTGLVQFVRVGKVAFIGGFNKVTKDILPYCIAEGFPSAIRAVNKVGLKRSGVTRETIKAIDDSYRTIIRSGLPLEEAAEVLRNRHGDVPEVEEMIAFATASKVGLARPREQGQGG